MSTHRQMLRGGGVQRFLLIASIIGFLCAGSASSARAITIGQLPATVPGATCNNSPFDSVEPAVTSGTSYVVPDAAGVTQWTLTSWSHFARAAATGQMLTMKVFRKVGEPNTYEVVKHDGPRDLTPGVINSFPTRLAVKAGDILGNNDANASDVANACIFAVPAGDSYRQRSGDLADGASGDFDITGYPGFRVNVSAEVVPTNTFTLGALTRNKKKGTATLSLNVPNPGELTGSGKGAKLAGTRGAVISKAVSPGNAQLRIKAKGKKKRTLSRKGKVKLNVAVTYTPTGGDASTQSVKVKLKEKL